MADQSPEINSNCQCNHPDSSLSLFNSTPIGIDITNARYGEVSQLTCTGCGQHWLYYFVEYEAFRGSGRWFRGTITPADLPSIRPETAADYISSLHSYIYGGSYFGSAGQHGSGLINVDL